jgi:hypothetical protein
MDRKKLNTTALMILAAIVVIGFFALLTFFVFIAIPIENKEILNITVGALIGSFTTVVGYFFGSSAGSANKTDIMASKPEV